MKKIFAFLLIALSMNIHAALTDIKFSRWQVADSQWNVSACLNTATCQIYSKNPGVAYRIPWTSGQVQWATGDYIKFSLSGNASFPYTAIQYTSVGAAKVTLGNGKIVNMGSDYFFFVGSDNNTGQLFSGSSGMSNTAGVTWTGTRNPTIAQADAIADASYSTEPLAAGSTATTTPNSSGGGSVAPAPTYTSEITAAQQSAVSAAQTRRDSITVGNRVDLDVSGPGNTVTIEQVGSWNKIGGLGGSSSWATVSGQNNGITVLQGDVGAGRNLVELGVSGNLNTVTVTQARSVVNGSRDGAESGGHIARVSVGTSGGTYVFRQGNDGGAASGHFLNYVSAGSGGTHRVTQGNNGSKIAFVQINGANITDTVMQTGSGSHFIDLTATGNGHNVEVTQKDTGSHRATINLVNAGGASNLQLVQQGSTAQVYSITQQCATLSGCSVSITQGQ